MPDIAGTRTSDSVTLHLWSLHEEVVVEGRADGSVVLRHGTRVWNLHRPCLLVRVALDRMTLGPVRLDNLTGVPVRPGDSGGCGELAELMWSLRCIAELVVHTLGHDDPRGPLLSVYCSAGSAPFRPKRPPDGSRVRLVPGAVSGREGDEPVMVAPRSAHRVRAHRPEVTDLLTALHRPLDVRRAAAAVSLPADVAAEILAYLVGAALVR
ncbi:hypothetical protein K4B79_14455 [Streptomyces lincolnensis]|uniref:hypothetical protein n=1 Tax=Streptomyces lincolnensis TaxID=1915 RepID=UPI001E3539F5|nr:hypothetical protein [Streptomyces lincolnensis]MCD7439429.1 hypothetical protein [Streptomyces lincolnensis]